MPVACHSGEIKFRFEDGVLWIREPFSETRFRWRPEPLAEEKGPRGRWRECWPALRLLAPENDPDGLDGSRDRVGSVSVETVVSHPIEESRRQALLAFRDSMPRELAALVEPFPSHQWGMLWLIAREKSVLDLAHSNPVLAYAMANHGDLRGFTPRTAAALALGQSRLKQREILAWLGFPATQSMVRLFRKMVPEAVVPSSLRLLRVAIERRPQTIDLLRHQPRINAGVLGLVISPWAVDCVTPHLLSEVAGDGRQLRRAETAHLLRKALRLVQAMDPRRPPPLIRSIEEAECFCRDSEVELATIQRWRARQGAAERERRARNRRDRLRLAGEALGQQQPPTQEDAGPLASRKRGPFPPPPVPGTEDIIPITNRAELRREGKLQENCVAYYAGQVLAGSSYIYAVMVPERATLQIKRLPNGSWIRCQLRASCNRPVRTATKRLVDNWLQLANRLHRSACPGDSKASGSALALQAQGHVD